MADRIKALSPDAVEKLQALEGKWGHCIVAYEGFPEPADLSSEELNEVQSLEKELKAVLVDYHC